MAVQFVYLFWSAQIAKTVFNPILIGSSNAHPNQMNSSDKDFRFMATNDLITELKKPSIKLDDEIEKKIVKMLLNLLEDKVGEVQNLAVKW